MSDIKLVLPFSAPPERLFEVCTNPQELTTWFAEHADIALDKSRYDFWGRHTPGNPPKSDGGHTVLRVEPGRALSYDWRLRGENTTVEYEFTRDGDSTLFRMTHRGLPELKPYQSSIGDFWTHVLEGLRSRLEFGKPYILPDYGDVPYGEVNVSLEIGADPHDVFMGLTQPDRLNMWIAKDAQVDLQPGGQFSYGWEHGPLKVVDLVPDKKLSYSWGWPGEPESITTWELEGSGGRTRLTVVQSGFDKNRNCEDYYIGWFKYIHRFKSLLEGGGQFQRVRVVSDAGVPVENNEV